MGDQSELNITRKVSEVPAQEDSAGISIEIAPNQTSAKPAAKLSAQAYDLVLEKLVSLEYRPGDILVEAEIAGQLGISRTPVREALRAMVAKGFLKVVPRTGYLVMPITPEDVRDIYQLRLLLEGEAAALAARRVGVAEVQAIAAEWKTRLREAERLNAGSQASNLLSPDDNTPFHLMVARASGNRRLAEMIDKVMQDSQRVMAYYRPKVDRSTLASYHLHILEEICTGDPERARAAMQNHVQEGITSIERWLGGLHRPAP